MEENRVQVTPLKNLLAESGIRLDHSMGVNSPYINPMLGNKSLSSTPSPAGKISRTPTIRVGLSRYVKNKNWCPFVSEKKEPMPENNDKGSGKKRKLEPAKLFGDGKKDCVRDLGGASEIELSCSGLETIAGSNLKKIISESRGKEGVSEIYNSRLKEKENINKTNNLGLKEKEIVSKTNNSGLKEKEFVNKTNNSGLKEKEIVNKMNKSRLKENEIIIEKNKSGLKQKEIINKMNNSGLKESINKTNNSGKILDPVQHDIVVKKLELCLKSTENQNTNSDVVNVVSTLSNKNPESNINSNIKNDTNFDSINRSDKISSNNTKVSNETNKSCNKKSVTNKSSKKRTLKRKKTSTPINSSDDEFVVDELEEESPEVKSVRRSRRSRVTSYLNDDEDDDELLSEVLERSKYEYAEKTKCGEDNVEEEINKSKSRIEVDHFGKDGEVKGKRNRKKRIQKIDDSDEDDVSLQALKKQTDRKQNSGSDFDKDNNEFGKSSVEVGDGNTDEEVKDRRCGKKRILKIDDSDDDASMQILKEQTDVKIATKKSDFNEINNELNKSTIEGIKDDNKFEEVKGGRKNRKERIIKIEDSDDDNDINLGKLKEQTEEKKNANKNSGLHFDGTDNLKSGAEKRLHFQKEENMDCKNSTENTIIKETKQFLNQSPSGNTIIKKTELFLNENSTENKIIKKTKLIMNENPTENTIIKATEQFLNDDDDFDVSVNDRKQLKGVKKGSKEIDEIKVKNSKKLLNRNKSSDIKETATPKKSCILQRIDFRKDSSPLSEMNDDNDFLDSPKARVFKKSEEKKRGRITKLQSDSDESVSSQDVKKIGGSKQEGNLRGKKCINIDSSSDEEVDEEKKNLSIARYNSNNSINSSASEGNKSKTFKRRTLSLKKTISNTTLTEYEDDDILNDFRMANCKVLLTQIPIQGEIIMEKVTENSKPEITVKPTDSISVIDKASLSNLKLDESFDYKSEDDLNDFQTPVKKVKTLSKTDKKGGVKIFRDESEVKTPTQGNKSTNLSGVMQNMDLQETNEDSTLHSLRNEVYDLESTVHEKQRKLEELQRAVHYKQIHNTTDLRKKTDIWKNGCKQALCQLLSKLRETVPGMNLKMLMARMSITPEFLDYDEENDCFK